MAMAMRSLDVISRPDGTLISIPRWGQYGGARLTSKGTGSAQVGCDLNASLLRSAPIRPRGGSADHRAHATSNFSRVSELTTLDWGVIALYFAFAAGIGVVLSRRAGSSVSEYFVGGRSLP